jgi:hypothetical protein
MFREDNLNSKIIRMYFELIGNKYRSSILLPTLSKISFTKESYEVSKVMMWH